MFGFLSDQPLFPNGVVTGHELQVDALLSQTCLREVVRMDSCAPNGSKIRASVWTCGAESGAERWNRASGVESVEERRDAGPDGSLGGAATSARFGDRNGQRRAGGGTPAVCGRSQNARWSWRGIWAAFAVI